MFNNNQQGTAGSGFGGGGGFGTSSSNFGGGIGQQQQQQPQQQPQPQPQSSFSSFGNAHNMSSTSTGFGTGSSGFGMGMSTPQPATTSATVFGGGMGTGTGMPQPSSASASSPFGMSNSNTTTGFGFGSSSSMTPATPASATGTTSVFGTSSNIAPMANNSSFGSNNTFNNNSANNTFSTGASKSVFGVSSNHTPMGTSSASFGTSPNIFQSGNTTANTNNNNNINTPMSNNTNNRSTFGTSSSISTGGFGVSSNVTSFGGGGSSNTNANANANVNTFGMSSTAASTAATTNPFASTSTSTSTSISAANSPFTMRSNTNANINNDHNDMGMDDNDNNDHDHSMGGGLGFQSPFSSGSNQNNQQQQQQQKVNFNNNNNNSKSPFAFDQSKSSANAAAASAKSDAEDKLAKLREKIELKKKQLKEKAKEKEAASKVNANKESAATTGGRAGSNLNTNISTNSATNSLNPNAESFKPGGGFGSFGDNNASAAKIKNNKDGHFSKKKIPKKKRPTNHSNGNNNKNHDDNGAKSKNDEKDRTKALAEKNALRFASNQSRDLTSYLPADLIQRASTERETNDKGATTLNGPGGVDGDADGGGGSSTDNSGGGTIGKCLFMCPDDELILREKESDIQLLEIPHEEIFPKDWTLRQTAVKRFRRSAADYTLNIPELVRPPYVLEIVCGYLEEWVMERDRQGVDPRFGQPGENISPPPLDVYQFIWDRTRMIRKDFILQNYTGTGGKCNAIAVRCHERIARWHCLCEHQLSHLIDYRKMQSQQNIQELGQTMKTLNLYYDDADGRATEPGDNENSGSSLSNLHGCTYDVVKGKDPIDYNGKSLANNSSSVDKRIISRASKTNGTAEPEMRGLYILLTINNDGGMEVLKYSARLSERSPEIFNSKPVQLALQVYKARRESNYARFFSILRSPSTPYLFGCIMFTYVEQMREEAFRIMSKTFGFRKKDTGEGVYDVYPLKDLVRLLCFENLDEAREACKHYNITVKLIPHPSQPNVQLEVIFWRQSDFKEKRDPTKGHVIRLQPQKMNRVIESKLKGATKLAICRGEVSGFGAILDKPISPSPRKSLGSDVSSRLLVRSESRRRKLEEERIQREREIAEAKRIAESRRIAEEEKLRREAQEKLLREQLLRREKERKEREARKDAALKAAKEKEDAKQREEKRMYEAHQAALKRKAEEKIQREKEKQRQEAERIRREQEIELQRRQEAERKAAEELKRLEEKRRKAVEEQRQREEIQRKAAEEERKRKEIELLRLREERKRAKEIKIKMEWEIKVTNARKFIVLQRWKSLLASKRDSKRRTIACLENFDPTEVKRYSVPHVPYETRITNPVRKNPTATSPGTSITYEDFFCRLGTDCSTQFDLGEMVGTALNNTNYWDYVESKRFPSPLSRSTFLFKLGIFVPKTEAVLGQQNLSRMMELWVDSRLQMNYVHLHECDRNHHVRAVATIIDDSNTSEPWQESFDAIITIIPPKCLGLCVNYPSVMNDILQMTINFDDIEHAEEDEFDGALRDGCNALFDEYLSILFNNSKTDEGCNQVDGLILEKLSLKGLCIALLKNAIWIYPDETSYLLSLPSHCQRAAHESAGDRIIQYCFSSLKLLLNKIIVYSEKHENNWPANEFIDSKSKNILGYFSEKESLPADWASLDYIQRVEAVMSDLFPDLETTKHLEGFLQNLLDGAPTSTTDLCGRLYHDRNYRRCLEYAFHWHEEAFLEKTTDHCIYLPLGAALKALEKTLEMNMEQADLKEHAVKVDMGTPSATRDAILGAGESMVMVAMEEGSENENREAALHMQSGASKRSSNDFQLESNIQKKRQKRRSTFEEDKRKSKNFTANLKSLVEGATLDVVVGDSYLSKILEDIDQ